MRNVYACAGVSDQMDVAIHTEIPVQGYAGAVPVVAPWHPQGVLVGHLAEHKGPVNSIAVAGNSAFLVSGSSDETVKIWDVRRLERDVSFRSRLTYASQVGPCYPILLNMHM
jgi:WD40 repeat protein